MPATFRHFAINADDVSRARTFYERAFGWTFDAYGPPGFFQIKNAGSGLVGALQQRREVTPGKPMPGIEISLGVEDLVTTIAAIEAGGGKIVMPPFKIPGVGELIFFEDTEGNVAGAIQYEKSVWA
jgi:predicted enzyme related to lactoylglutathione lyase